MCGKRADGGQEVVDGLKVGAAFECSASDPGYEARYLDRVGGLGVRVVDMGCTGWLREMAKVATHLLA